MADGVVLRGGDLQLREPRCYFAKMGLLSRADWLSRQPEPAKTPKNLDPKKPQHLSFTPFFRLNTTTTRTNMLLDHSADMQINCWLCRQAPLDREPPGYDPETRFAGLAILVMSMDKNNIKATKRTRNSGLRGRTGLPTCR